ncbi:hypothetical protein CEUSTIGMA_g8645.t1 [Chlamydomonas eustigma]|uniref:Armadillo repeat-containing protein 6 n=1 Tax=Chlamydomonas eustigma TaxID=1157962 RepID=A0A250XDN9_9CHLO|nr:hypothetical protein CEUSTIGMA_g8645.t1 [Chlamydomonas eustigma]|eukprot:GAX81213.1 hypothetical protein CEUSTIGMA_g8645.t1 [Chlamydomonas eustigma]
MAQMWPPPKPKLAQEEFDESVKTNMEDFDMNAEEAIKSACEEFTVQGYDISGIIKKVGGGQTDDHPLTVASTNLDNALETEIAEGSPFLSALLALRHALMDESADPLELNAVVLKAKTYVPAFIACCKLSAACLSAAPSSANSVKEWFQTAINVTKRIMLLSVEARDLFDAMKGGEVVVGWLRDHAGDIALQVAVVGLAEVAALKEEKNKESLFNAGFGEAALQLLREAVNRCEAPGTMSSSGNDVTESPAEPSASAGERQVDKLDLALIRGCCNALRLLVTADDDRPAGSAAFKNARVLAKEGGASATLMAVLRSPVMRANSAPEALSEARQGGSSTSHAATVSGILAAVRQFAVNDEICREFAEEGGVLAVGALLDHHQRAASGSNEGCWTGRSATVVRAALLALRQMVNSDAVKVLLAEKGGIEMIMNVMSIYSTSENILEPSLGLLSSMMLRLPEVVDKAAEAGVIDAVLEVMSGHPDAGQLQRAGCMVFRNMAARNVELRPVILEKGAEALLRQAQAKHPNKCQDVGAAALRDLGLEDYGTTLVVTAPLS